jgi:hypothetical protein
MRHSAYVFKDEEDGFIERQIRGLSRMVAQATVGQQADQTETLDQVDAAYGELFDIPAELLDVIEPSAMRALVRPERIPSLLGLLEADARLADAAGNTRRAALRRALIAALR